jgi:hypothetical protein
MMARFFTTGLTQGMVRMRKFVGVLAFATFATLLASPGFAQTQQENPPATQAQQQSPAPGQTQKATPPSAQTRKRRKPSVQVTRIELAAGGTFNRYVAPTGLYLDMIGWDGSADYNLWRWLAAEADAYGDYGRKAFVGTTSVYAVLAGPKFFPLRHHKITPWGHFLFGQGYYRDSIPSFGGFPSHVNSDFAFTWEGGVGLDVNYRKRWGIRLLQFDYGATRFYHSQPNEPAQSNYRVEIGLIYKLGKR